MKQWVGNRSDANVKTKNLGNANLLSSLLNTDKALPKHQLAAQPNSRALQLRYYYYYVFLIRTSTVAIFRSVLTEQKFNTNGHATGSRKPILLLVRHSQYLPANNASLWSLILARSGMCLALLP